MRVVLVTGGTRGIGRAIAQAFAAQGDTVVVCARKPIEGLYMPFLAADVRDPAQAQGVVSQVVARFGRLDVLVNNAGGSPPADSSTASPRFSEAILRLNLLAPLVLSQAANQHMQSGAGGVIVNVCSVSGTRASPNTAAYGAAKAGLLNLTRTFAQEWAPKVRVVAVTPGLVATPEAAEHYPDVDAAAATVPMGRLGTPADVAAACVWLASDAASYITGASLVLDGGGDRPAFLAALPLRKEPS